MLHSLRIAVVGYGSGGQAAAVLLSRDGHRVEVFERVQVPQPVGAGFLLQPTGLRVLWELDLLLPVLGLGAPITRLYGQTVSGRAVMDMRYSDLDRRLYGLGLQRGALFRLLDEAWTVGRRLHAGHAIVRVDAEKGSVTDAAGQHFNGYDLVVVADGAASSLRGQVVKARLDRPYPWGAQWCLVEQGDWSWPDELQQRYVAARRMAGMLPVGTRPDDPVPRLSFFWSVPASRLQADPVDPRAWRKSLGEVWPEAAVKLEHTSIPESLAAARYRDTVHRHWHRGRAVLLGDAAHAMSPQLGQGVNMALLDALALRDALREASTLPDALMSYQKQRRRHLGIYHFWSRWLTPLFQSGHDGAAALRDRLFHPLSRSPIGRGQMLRVLTGTRRGWFGRLALPGAFVQALPPIHGPVPAGPTAGRDA